MTERAFFPQEPGAGVRPLGFPRFGSLESGPVGGDQLDLAGEHGDDFRQALAPFQSPPGAVEDIVAVAVRVGGEVGDGLDRPGAGVAEDREQRYAVPMVDVICLPVTGYDPPAVDRKQLVQLVPSEEYELALAPIIRKPDRFCHHGVVPPPPAISPDINP